MHAVVLPRLGTFEAWRDAARQKAGTGIAAQDVEWRLEGEAASLFADARPPEAKASRALKVPQSFLGLANKVVWHSEPARFDLLYGLLMRLQSHPGLLRDRSDPQVARVSLLEKSVRRDMHKMKAFVRFREVAEPVEGRRQFFAWFEPEHAITEPISGFFARRFGDMDWVIATPQQSVECRAGRISHDLTPRSKPNLEDPTEELWRTYFANIFNPARLKVKAMTSEMPKKYWKNLPEAALIPDMIAGAEARMREMAAAAPSMPPARAAAISGRLRAQIEVPVMEGGLDGVRGAMSTCARCPIGARATQCVAGEGSVSARLMVVGEQPGDQEDLSGRPFVGPAGQLLDKAMADAGMSRQDCYLTNAVKHFKFTARGKRRIHQNPNRSEVEACLPWLKQEVQLVRPQLIVALGATALAALTGSGADILKRRGGVEKGWTGVPVLVTLHPSFVLRQPDHAREEAFAQLVADLKQAASRVGAESLSNS